MSANQKKNVRGGRGGGNRNNYVRRNDAQQDASQAPPDEDPSKMPIFRMRDASGAANDYVRTKERMVEYVGRSLPEVTCIVEKLEDPENEEPDDEFDAKDKIAVIKYESLLKRYDDRAIKLGDQKKKLYSILWGALSRQSLSTVKDHEDFKDVDRDPLKLMEIIEETHLLGVAEDVDDSPAERQRIMNGYNKITQGYKETDEWFRDRFLAEAERYNQLMKRRKIPELTRKDMAAHFVLTLNDRKHGRYKLACENGIKPYPETVEKVMGVIRTFREDDPKASNHDVLIRNAYAAGIKAGTGADGKPCWNCGKEGHFAKDCTAPTKEQHQQKQPKGGKGGKGGGASNGGSNNKLSDELKKQLKSIKPVQRKAVAHLLTQLEDNDAADDSDYGSDRPDGDK